ncbi:hypothetical protein ACIPSA_18380 [Streptomyces sp. NPDC086549]|uniref:hypothetical protein n=1 Tax=Streptomyces sp. NPDC086549 TaxID=3365752 RepID=UPI0038290867
MFKKTLHTIGDRLTEMIDLVRDVDRRLDKLEVIALVREPAAATSADAYDGLRKQVVASATARWAHLAQLAQLDAALAQGAGQEVIRTLAQGWITQAALERVRDGEHPEADLLFELVEDHGGPLEVLEPAYVDGLTGRLVRQGRARRAEPLSTSAAAGPAALTTSEEPDRPEEPAGSAGPGSTGPQPPPGTAQDRRTAGIGATAVPEARPSQEGR